MVRGLCSKTIIKKKKNEINGSHLKCEIKFTVYFTFALFSQNVSIENAVMMLADVLVDDSVYDMCLCVCLG